MQTRYVANMSLTRDSRLSGRYSASLLGTIRSNLEGLQGYDVMALELLQNADDAKAEEINFEVTDDGLSVWNSGTFSYCGALESQECPLLETTGYGCDFHRITEVASGGKLRRGDNIGRFGIGFVSTYQITDHPEISSNGFKLRLYPERAAWDLRPEETKDGTHFYLPWATDPNSDVRRKLGVSAIEHGHVNKLVDDFKEVLRDSLLFLRHARKARLHRNGELILSCALERYDDSELVITLQPAGEVERWCILRSDATKEAEALIQQNPSLKELNRATKVAVGIRVAPRPLEKGCLYAFLPTIQSSGLPLHLNADFFPEPDRKAIIFSGHQHQQAWNEMLVHAAGRQLAHDLDLLNSRLDQRQFWQLIKDAFDLTGSNRSAHPDCFSLFWTEIKSIGITASIVSAHDGGRYTPAQVLFTDTPLTEAQATALEKLGAHIVSDDLRSYRNVLVELGTPLLTLERMVDLMESSSSKFLPSYSKCPDRLDDFVIPLWEVLEALLPPLTTKGIRPTPSLEKLKKIPFIVARNLGSLMPQDCVLVPKPLSSSSVSSLLPFLSIATERLWDYPKIAALIAPLTIDRAATALSNRIAVTSSPAATIDIQGPRLRDLYSLLANLDAQASGDQNTYSLLKELPIWLTGKGLVPATRTFLPGDFHDPTGQAELMDLSVLTPISKEFIEKKLQMKTQTIDTYVRGFLPHFFSPGGPSDETKYQLLIAELARHGQLIDDPALRKILASLRLVPTMDGKWGTPQGTYYRSQSLIDLIGDANHLWVDESRFPTGLSARSFLNNLGIQRSASPAHLVDRMDTLARNSSPTEMTRKASAVAFYELCDRYDKSKESLAVGDAIRRLVTLQCFPAEGDTQSWHLARTLYAPYRSDGFRSQAKILDFKDTQRLKSEVLTLLSVTIEPDTTLVVAHFLWCIEHNVEPHFYTYQILNERSTKGDPAVQQLRDLPCIYVAHMRSFVRPGRVFWTAQQLDRFAYVLPSTLESFRSFFRAVGVKDAPSPTDLADIILEILNDYFPKQASITGKDLAVYEVCMRGIASCIETETPDQNVLQTLREAPSILNLANRPCHPDEVLYKDSEWHAGLFDGALDEALCRPSPEVLVLTQTLGVKTLSECCNVTLDFVGGDERTEPEFAVTLSDRVTIVSRLLHDQLAQRRDLVIKALSTLSASSHDVIRIKASVNLAGAEALSVPRRVPAFYDQSTNVLSLARPLGARSWPHIFIALFHQLLPNESASEISKLALILDPLMNLSVSDAHQRLTDAGVPVETELSVIREDLQSAELDHLTTGATTDSTQVNSDQTGVAENDPSCLSGRPPGEELGAQTKSGSNSIAPPLPSGAEQPSDKASHSSGSQSSPGESKGVSGNGAAKPNRSHRPRSQHKEEWDRRLLSYVNRRHQTANGEQTEGNSEHNLIVEAAARDAVCDYETARGRVPQKLAQSHPGFDIVSLDPTTGVERRIEVKGRSGEWNQLGVGLTRMEFSNAQDFGDEYWLYVVEFALDKKVRRIYPIQNPAFKIDAFMFDRNWREVAIEEQADPAYAFQQGTRISHETYGIGIVQRVELRGSIKMIRVQFERGGERIVPLNLAVMTVLDEEPNGDDHP